MIEIIFNYKEEERVEDLRREGVVVDQIRLMETPAIKIGLVESSSPRQFVEEYVACSPGGSTASMD